MSAVAIGLRMSLLASGQSVEVVNMVPDLSKVTDADEDVGWQSPPPPTASRQGRWRALSSRWWSRAPRAPLAAALLQMGSGA